MILLLDIGNTHSHLGLADANRVLRHVDIPTAGWASGVSCRRLKRWVGRQTIDGAVLCSVVPIATPVVQRCLQRTWSLRARELIAKSCAPLEIDYPRPETIGPDRLANAIAARTRFGSPAVVVDFGTAVTLDIIDRRGRYSGGVIAPGLAAMTDYLHEKTALLPRIRIREVRRPVGRSTEEAMLIGAVHGYRGLIRSLLAELKKELRSPRLPVVATGGYAQIIARGLPEITAVAPTLTLEGLRLHWLTIMSQAAPGS
jgi:type III pantothenate kinase